MAEEAVVLLIEDDAASAEVCLKTIREKVPEIRAEHEPDFAKAESRVQTVSPDIIVLDLYEDDPVAEDAAAGVPFWAKLWQEKFCPLIFHTAHDAPADPPVPANHPFVKFVTKKAKSDLEVADHLRAFLPHVRAVRQVQKEVVGVLQTVLQDVAGIIWGASINEDDRQKTLIRAARRRVAAMMDEATLADGKPMTSWEQYLVPALGDDLLMGDVLLATDGAKDEPTSYRLVLTPSCDMVKGRKTCLPQVLVAKCGPITNYVRSAGILEAKEEKKREKLVVLLTQEECGGYVALPPLPGVLPVMAAGLRDLEFVAMDSVSTGAAGNATFVRVASIDSPFREKLAWTYLQIAARPGMPDCDSNEFIDAIVKAATATGGAKKP